MTWLALRYECELACGFDPQWPHHLAAIDVARAQARADEADRKRAQLELDVLSAERTARRKAQARAAHERSRAKVASDPAYREHRMEQHRASDARRRARKAAAR